LDEKGNFVRSPHVIPFSVGPRHCLGEQIARMEFFIFLVSLIQRFEFLPDPNSDKLPDINTGSNGVIFVSMSYKLVAKELWVTNLRFLFVSKTPYIHMNTILVTLQFAWCKMKNTTSTQQANWPASHFLKLNVKQESCEYQHF